MVIVKYLPFGAAVRLVKYLLSYDGTIQWIKQELSS